MNLFPGDFSLTLFALASFFSVFFFNMVAVFFSVIFRVNQFSANPQFSAIVFVSFGVFLSKTFLDGKPQEMFYEDKTPKTITFRVFGKKLFEWSSKSLKSFP